MESTLSQINSLQYLPKTIVLDLGTTFTSSLMHELCSLLKIRLKRAKLKHPQVIGLVERSNAYLKRILKLNTNDQWSNWLKYVSLATFIHNTSYNSSIACCSSAVFHGQEPIKPLVLRFPVKSLETATANSDYVSAFQDAMLLKLK